MAEITLNIPDAFLQRVIDALCDQYHYDQNANEDETRPQFAKRAMALHLKTALFNYESRLAVEAAQQAVNDELEDIDIN